MIREWETDRQTDKKRECFDPLLTWLSLQIEYSFLIAFNFFFYWSTCIILYLTYLYNCIFSFLFRIYYICLTNCKYDVGKYAEHTTILLNRYNLHSASWFIHQPFNKWNCIMYICNCIVIKFSLILTFNS